MRRKYVSIFTSQYVSDSISNSSSLQDPPILKSTVRRSKPKLTIHPEDEILNKKQQAHQTTHTTHSCHLLSSLSPKNLSPLPTTSTPTITTSPMEKSSDTSDSVFDFVTSPSPTKISKLNYSCEMSMSNSLSPNLNQTPSPTKAHHNMSPRSSSEMSSPALSPIHDDSSPNNRPSQAISSPSSSPEILPTPKPPHSRLAQSPSPKNSPEKKRKRNKEYTELSKSILRLLPPRTNTEDENRNITPSDHHKNSPLDHSPSPPS